MLSYQHSYHAGNLADIHKHRLLAETLAAMVSDDAPVTYMETHSGRGVYDLSGPEAAKTGEAKEGLAALRALPETHPYRQCVAQTKARYGEQAYPGSPQIARLLLRASDALHLHELHPQEYAVLTARIKAKHIRMYKKDGYKGVLSLAARAQGRGVVMIDPSYEIKSEYDTVAAFIPELKRKWPVAAVLLWYPVLEAGLHAPMLAALSAAFPEARRDEAAFSEASRLRMQGSGMWIA